MQAMSAKDMTMCIRACSEAAQLGNDVYFYLLPADIRNRVIVKNSLNSQL